MSATVAIASYEEPPVVDVCYPWFWWASTVYRGLRDYEAQPGRGLRHADVPVSTVRTPTGRRLTVCAPHTARDASPGDGVLRLVFCDTPAHFDGWRAAYRLQPAPEDTWRAVLLVGIGELAGWIEGYALAPGSAYPAPVRTLDLPGPGMQRFGLHGRDAPRSPWLADPELFSRSRGALGDETFRRLSGSRVAVVGAGRHGSLAAATLAGMGVRGLSLIDPDVVEPNSLDGMEGVGVEDLGRPKAEAVADALQLRWPWCAVEAIPSSVRAPEAMQAVRSSDLVIAAVDNFEALLVAGAVAHLYARPLVVLGAGVFRPGGRLEVGSEITVLLPGEACVVCFDCITDLHAVRYRLAHPEPVPATPPDRDFRAERAGSLRSLNTTTVGVACRSIEELYLNRLHQSARTRLHWEAGTLHVDRQTPNRMANLSGECLCALTGAGDAGIARFDAWLRRDRLSFRRFR